MKKAIAKTVKAKEEFYIEFTDEELSDLHIEKGQKFSCEIQDGGVMLTPYAKVDIDMEDWDRSSLEFLIQQSCERDISVNQIIEEIITQCLKSQDVE